MALQLHALLKRGPQILDRFFVLVDCQAHPRQIKGTTASFRPSSRGSLDEKLQLVGEQLRFGVSFLDARWGRAHAIRSAIHRR